MKRFLLLFLISLPCCASAQNIEGQIVASQFGEFKVQSEGNGFAFDPANCNVSGGGKNFPAFATGTPVKVVDSNPAQIEIVIPVNASITGSYCTVSLPTRYTHTSFYLTSGTGGIARGHHCKPDKQWNQLNHPELGVVSLSCTGEPCFCHRLSDWHFIPWPG